MNMSCKIYVGFGYYFLKLKVYHHGFIMHYKNLDPCVDLLQQLTIIVDYNRRLGKGLS